MVNPITLSDSMQIVAEDICFTAIEWSATVARVNADAQTALTYGLVIGAIVGAAGLYFGLWYNGHRKK